MSDVMLENQLDTAVTMIDPRAWGGRLRILMLLRREMRAGADDGWVFIGYRQVAKSVKLAERYCDTVLKEMVVERVLLRGELGSGQRGTAYKINPKVWQWRRVPWLEEDQELRDLRIRSPFRASHRGATQGLAPRPHVAAQGGLAPRSHVAAQDSLAPRSRTGRYDSPSAAIQSAALGVDSDAPSSSGTGRRPDGLLLLDEKEQETDAFRTLKAAVEAKCYPRTIDGPRLLARLGALTESSSFDLDRMIRAIAICPDDWKPPYVVDHLEKIHAGRKEFREPGRPAGDEVARLEAEAERLRAMIATYEQDDIPTNDLTAALQECENRIAQRREAST